MIDGLRDGWNQAAREDAMHNIVSTQVDWDTDEFFAHGQVEIDQAMERAQTFLHKTGRALDFGCGIGRLTQALAKHFKRVDGVDISPEMIDRARSHNRFPSRVEYHLNTKRLPFRAGTFDFVYSMIVLQHMPQPLAEGYVGEFLRVLRPKGVAVFNIPDGPDYQHASPWLSMFGTDPATVETWVREAKGELVDRECLDDETWRAYRYTAIRV